jgi:pimeloyl-ACP methyl ester carboxylesterase/DNA-binding CsgD family transcriptional regulator
MHQSRQQIRFCTSRDGTHVAYATVGSGPPLVWVPHWMRNLNMDWDSPLWCHWLNLLAQHHTVVRYDYRGCGLSDRENIAFSLDKHVEDLEAIALSAGLQKFALVGQAGGGLVSLAYAAKHPGKVTRLVLYGCQARGRSARGMPLEAARESEALLKLIEFGWRNEGPAYGQFFVTLHMPDANVEQVRSACDLLRATTSPANGLEILRVFFHADVAPIVPTIRAETLVLHAREDPIIPFSEGRALAALISNSHFVPLESRNHILQEDESAWAEAARAITEFLSIGNSAATLADLTSRERQVLKLIAEGHDNRTIGKRLELSERTVRNYVSIILNKLGVRTRAQAIVRARDAQDGGN